MLTFLFKVSPLTSRNEVLHSQSLTWNLKKMVFPKKNIFFQGLISRLHVKLPGVCICSDLIYFIAPCGNILAEVSFWLTRRLLIQQKLRNSNLNIAEKKIYLQLPIPSMGLVYLPTFGWLFKVNVGKYISPMDGMGLPSTFFWDPGSSLEFPVQEKLKLLKDLQEQQDLHPLPHLTQLGNLT